MKKVKVKVICLKIIIVKKIQNTLKSRFSRNKKMHNRLIIILEDLIEIWAPDRNKIPIRILSKKVKVKLKD